MNKYSKKLVLDYISGNDIVDYEIDKLENDKDFMMLVIETSKDSNFYNLCSDKLKKDYEFVKYLVIKFKEKLDFICKVADYFLEFNEEEIPNVELNILMNNLTINNKEKNIKYKLECEALYTYKRVLIEKVLTEKNEYRNCIDMGFIALYEFYSGSEIILNYYANKMIEEIFNDNNINLELMLHKQFKTSNQIDNISINGYIIDLLSYYDNSLATYISSHINLIKPIKEKIINIKNKWDNNDTYIEAKKYNLVFKKVQMYMEEIGDNVSFSETDILYYIGKKLNIIDKIAKYDNIDKEQLDIIKENMDEEFFEDMLIQTPQDRFYYELLLKIVSSVIFNKDSDDISSSSKSKNSKVLKVNFKK